VSARQKPGASGSDVVARNPKARYDYHILETWEAGLVLTGSEIKSVRDRKVSLKEAFGTLRNGEVWIESLHIMPYTAGGYANHDPVRRRKLLLHRREIGRLIGAVQQQGLTLVPLDLHLSDGRAKVTLALARGKKQHDRREDLKRRDAERELARVFRGRR
jgi:SsrA-binding protein